MPAVDIGEYQAITDTIQHYLNGARSGKGDDMRPAFHAQATIFGYVGLEFFGGPIEKLYAWNDANGPAKDVVTNVTIIEIVGTVAIVRVEADNWTGHRFTDYFTMLKADGRWQIMNKTFHLHDE